MDEDFKARIIADLAEIEKTRMPFGRYATMPVYDLPAEYLQYFATRGFPKSRLGELLRIIYQMKADGADCAFHEMRQRAGGRTPLRKPRPRIHRTF